MLYYLQHPAAGLPALSHFFLKPFTLNFWPSLTPHNLGALSFQFSYIQRIAVLSASHHPQVN